MKRILKLIVSLIIIISIILVYLNFTYLFSPISYRKDNITYLPYTWYKKPMTYEFTRFDKDKSKATVSKNIEDIKFIYKELRKSKVLGTTLCINKSDNNISDQVKGVLVIQSSKEGGCTISTLRWQGENSNICVVSGAYRINEKDTVTDLYIEITNELKVFLNKKFEEI